MRHLAMKLRRTMLAAFVALAATGTASAQLSISVDTQWMLDADAAHPGSAVRAVLRVEIEEDWHVNSDKPLEDFLIPTSLTVTPPEGVSVQGVIYPEALLLASEASEDKMAVFETVFTIGVTFDIADDLAPGTYPFTAELRYQACNDVTCLMPQNLALSHDLTIVAAGESINANDDPIFDEIDWSGAGNEAGGGFAQVAEHRHVS